MKMNRDEIQSVIDKAASQKTKTLIHFSYGKYNIQKTLKIPGNAEIILIGDGLSSILTWTGNANEAMD